MQRKFDSKQGLVPFTITVTIVSFLLFIYLHHSQGPVPETEGFREELGEALGSLGIFGLVLIYGRSILKIFLNEGAFLQRFIPERYHDLSVSAPRLVLNILNRTHKHVGATVVGLLISHALIMGTSSWNLFLVLLLILLSWQGMFGLFLLVRFQTATLKRYSYLVHAQLFSGVMIGIFAVFGHLLA